MPGDHRAGSEVDRWARLLEGSRASLGPTHAQGQLAGAVRDEKLFLRRREGRVARSARFC